MYLRGMIYREQRAGFLGESEPAADKIKCFAMRAFTRFVVFNLIENFPHQTRAN